MSDFTELVRRQLHESVRGLPETFSRRMSPGRRADHCVNVHDLRRAAGRSVPRAVFDFVDGAANDERTARRNEQDLAALRLRPRVLADVGDVDLTTTVLGHSVKLPLLGAPTGLTGLVHPEGELGIARAAERAGTVYVLSAMGSYSIEEVARGSAAARWFQLYVWRDRGLVAELVARAADAGYTALVITVDVPRAGTRERDIRNGFGIPPRLTLRTLAHGACRPRWSWNFVRSPRFAAASVAGTAGSPTDAVSLTDYINAQFDPTLSWDTIEWIRGLWQGPIVLKGILRADDARRAAGAGASAVVVSNHGGRQLDCALSTIDALPPIADAVGSEIEVYLDGGIRRGGDVLKALALGARACLIGRPLVYGLGVAGRAGAYRALDILGTELKVAMALSGCRRIRDITPDLVKRD